jgi:NADPH-dependent 2,4-dienoyl-CoA reductase/sulfur reductase-like enzyme
LLTESASQDQAAAFNARLRAHVVRSFAPGGNIDIAIVGGGATGVELAAELSRMVELAAGYGEAEISQRLRLTLLESAPRILSAFPEAISEFAASQLRLLGVDVRTGVRVGASSGPLRAWDTTGQALRIMLRCDDRAFSIAGAGNAAGTSGSSPRLCLLPERVRFRDPSSRATEIAR